MRPWAAMLALVAMGGSALAHSAPARGEPGASPREVARYRGILPCADCSALKDELALFAGASGAAGTYRERLTYVGTRDGDRSFTSTGHWSRMRGSAADASATLYRFKERGADARARLAVVTRDAMRYVDDEGRDLPSPIPQVLWRAEPQFTGAPVVATGSSRKPIALRPGQELLVRLAANPTTGYRWALAPATGATIVMSASPVFQEDAPAKGRMGAGGRETWRFMALAPGREDIVLEYRRPWEKDAPPARTERLSVEVRAR